MQYYYQYHYLNEFIMDYHTPEQSACAYVQEVSGGLHFFVLTNEPHLNTVTRQLLNIYLTEHEKFSLYDFVPFMRHQCREELTLKHRIMFGVLDSSSCTLRFINFGMYHVLFRDSFGLVHSARDREDILSDQPTPFRIQVYPMDDIHAVFFANSTYMLDAVENHGPRFFTKKKLLSTIQQQDESVQRPTDSFLFIHHLARHMATPLFTEHITNPELNELSALELRFEEALSGADIHEELADSATLIFHEMLLNAFEHGLLRISSTQKQELIRSGKYDDYICEQEKDVKGTIDIGAEVFHGNLLRISILDSGDGFEFESYLRTRENEPANLFHNRGIRITQELSDGIYYSLGGRRVHLLLSLPQGDAAEISHRNDSNGADLYSIADISILYVEDDELTRELYVRLLKRMTKDLYVAENGQEGLALYHKFHPDIVLSDIQMPVMNGLDMAKEIRQHNKDVPILLITAFSDKDHILSAIDAGIDRFINKPVQLGKLRLHLEHYARLIRMQQQLQKRLEEEQRRKEEEFFALRDKNRREELQQKEAFAKEQLIIQNDSAKLQGLNCEVFYHPQDILSGDIYGIIKVDENRSFFYIIDSMGKGIGASVTAILSASYLNQHLRVTAPESIESLQPIIDSYAHYIKNYLLDDEVISLTMIFLDRQTRVMEYSSFGMYPVFIKDRDSQTLHECRTNNIPLMIYSQDIHVGTFALPEHFHILLYSDGLCENDYFTGAELRKSFMQSASLEAILQDFLRATDNQAPVPGADDTSIIFIANS